MEQENQTFPRELLSQPKQERFHYFKNKVLGHDRLLAVHGQLERAFLYPPGDSLILIYGPTGVGKTTLRMRIEQALLKIEMEAMLKDPGYLPFVSMEAIAASRSYDWREHLIRTLKAANEPLISNKINPEAHKQSQGRNLVRNNKDTEMVLRRSLESCLHQRRTKYVIIDEAQHLKRVGSGSKYVFQMDTIKSLAETTGAIHILFGTYELLELTGLSAQLCRRSTYVHFSRYSNHDDDDQIAFASMLESFQRHLPLAQSPDLLSYEDYLYEKTFGCIGVLKTLLNDALSMALSSEDEIMTKEMLEKSAPPLRDLVQMSREIADGERILRETDEQLIELRNFLAVVPPEGHKKDVDKKVTISQEPAAGETKREKTDGQSADQPIVKPKQLRPGVRLPKRDKVGRNKKVG
jgi:DNA polymerase III delta prime subunit